ncbi:MAG: hypothetical protein HZB56_09270 [Deltaproteobacteria bacterium]|nr:hypothetical protein [Deltaproteobacteria bacterium]
MLAQLAALLLAQADPVSPLPLAPRPVLSLLGGEQLGVGDSLAAGQAGYATVSAAYAQGLGQADVGAELSLAWTTGEVTAAGLGRRTLWRSGTWSLGLRARAGLYLALGPSFGRYAHRGDTGLLLAPGLALSTAAGAAQVGFGLDLPMAVTFRRGGGTWISPVLSATVEVPLAGDLSAGARLSVARRWDSGGAPGALRSADNLGELLLLVAYRIL